MTTFANCLHTSVSVHFGGHATHSRQLKGGCVRTRYEWFCSANLYLEIPHNSKEQYYCMQDELLMNNTLKNAKLVYTDRARSLGTWHCTHEVSVCHTLMHAQYLSLLCVHMCMCVCIGLCAFMCECVCGCMLCMCVCVCNCVRVYVCMCVCVCLCVQRGKCQPHTDKNGVFDLHL